MPGIQRELAVDTSGTMLITGGDSQPTAVGGQALFIVDTSHPFALSSADQSGRDARIVFEAPVPKGIDGMSIDSARGLLYVGWPEALDIWAITALAKGRFNRPPVAKAGPDVVVDWNSVVTLDGSGSSDPDGDAITFKWTQIAGPLVQLSHPTMAKPTFGPTASGALLTFQLIVNDGKVDSPPDTVTITVRKSDQIHLRPRLLLLPKAFGTRPLNVFYEPGNGFAPDGILITGDPHVEYRWLKGCRAPAGAPPCQALVPGVDKVPDIAALNEIEKHASHGRDYSRAPR